MERLHPDKSFSLVSDHCDQATLPVDAVDYSELLSILLDNAGKWARSEVELTFVCDSDGVVIARISDDGPGMTSAELADAFLLGSRFDTTKPGAGLGLAIARDIADAMGAELEIVNGETGLVAKVTCRLEDEVRKD